jgi:hypothetical protein
MLNSIFTLAIRGIVNIQRGAIYLFLMRPADLCEGKVGGWRSGEAERANGLIP